MCPLEAWQLQLFYCKGLFTVCRQILSFDGDVSTSYCRSLSGDGVDLLSSNISITVVASDWFIRNLICVSRTPLRFHLCRRDSKCVILLTLICAI